MPRGGGDGTGTRLCPGRERGFCAATDPSPSCGALLISSQCPGSPCHNESPPRLASRTCPGTIPRAEDTARADLRAQWGGGYRQTGYLVHKGPGGTHRTREPLCAGCLERQTCRSLSPPPRTPLGTPWASLARLWRAAPGIPRSPGNQKRAPDSRSPAGHRPDRVSKDLESGCHPWSCSSDSLSAT